MNTEYSKGYEDGIATVILNNLCFSATSLESAAHWLARSEAAGALEQADRLRIAIFASVITEALASISKSLPMVRAREAAE